MEMLIGLAQAHPLIALVTAAFAALGAFSVIASMTPSTTDDDFAKEMRTALFRLIHTFGLNFKGKGK